jgi:hypothetical protein
MSKFTIQKDGVTQIVKERYLKNFLDRGWEISNTTTDVQKVFSKKTAKVEVTAEVIEEDETPQIEDESSMPNYNQGDE